MARNYAELAFSPEVKALQEKFGSRESYARMEKNSFVDGLTDNEKAFIGERDSFYMATIGENGFPYIQHRGGPKGFIRILGPKRIACIDFRGNMQYISVGNIATHNQVSLIMVDYASRARLKIYAKASVLELDDEPGLYETLDLDDYQFKPERMLTFDIQAYDWNCPQHITPRYTLEQIQEVFASQREEIVRLETENKALRSKLK